MPACCNLAHVIRQLADPTHITVTRRPAGSFGADGYYDSAAPDSLAMVAHVQPVTPGEAVRMLPDLQVTEEIIAVWTTEALYDDAQGSRQADLVLYEGGTYEVQKVRDFSTQGGYWKSICTMVAAP